MNQDVNFGKVLSKSKDKLENFFRKKAKKSYTKVSRNIKSNDKENEKENGMKKKRSRKPDGCALKDNLTNFKKLKTNEYFNSCVNLSRVNGVDNEEEKIFSKNFNEVSKSAFNWKVLFTAYKKAEKPVTDTKEALLELVKSEVDLVGDLRMLCLVYRNSIRTLSLLTNEETDVIFNGLEGLIPVHEELLQGLQGADCGMEKVSGIIGGWVHKLVVYENYCKGVVASKHMYHKCLQLKPPFRDFLRRCTSSSFSRRLDLWTLIDAPRCRLVKYPLFFKRIFKNALQYLNPCLDIVRGIISDMDEHVGKANCSFVISKINNITSYLVTSKCRYLVCEGCLKTEKGTELQVYLFDAALVLCVPHKEHPALYRAPIELEQVMLVVDEEMDKQDDVLDGGGGGDAVFTEALEKKAGLEEKRVSSLGRQASEKLSTSFRNIVNNYKNRSLTSSFSSSSFSLRPVSSSSSSSSSKQNYCIDLLFLGDETFTDLNDINNDSLISLDTLHHNHQACEKHLVSNMKCVKKTSTLERFSRRLHSNHNQNYHLPHIITLVTKCQDDKSHWLSCLRTVIKCVPRDRVTSFLWCSKRKKQNCTPEKVKPVKESKINKKEAGNIKCLTLQRSQSSLEKLPLNKNFGNVNINNNSTNYNKEINNDKTNDKNNSKINNNTTISDIMNRKVISEKIKNKNNKDNINKKNIPTTTIKSRHSLENAMGMPNKYFSNVDATNFSNNFRTNTPDNKKNLETVTPHNSNADLNIGNIFDDFNKIKNEVPGFKNKISIKRYYNKNNNDKRVRDKLDNNSRYNKTLEDISNDNNDVSYSKVIRTTSKNIIEKNKAYNDTNHNNSTHHHNNTTSSSEDSCSCISCTNYNNNHEEDEDVLCDCCLNHHHYLSAYQENYLGGCDEEEEEQDGGFDHSGCSCISSDCYKGCCLD